MPLLTRRRLVAVLSLGALGAGGLWAWRSYAPGLKPDPTDRIATVRRGPLSLRIVEDGTLQSVKANQLMVEVRRQVKIVKIVPEGTQVRKGDVVAELDRAEMEQQIQQLQAQCGTATQAVTVAEGEDRIQGIMNDNNLQNARAAVAKAESDLAKYLELEGPKAAKDLSVKLADARSKQEDARKQRSELVEKQEAELFVEEGQEDQARKALDEKNRALASLQTALEVVQLDQKIFRLYGHPAQVNALRAASAKARIDLEQAGVAAESALLGKKNQLALKRNELRQLTTQLEETQKELEKLVLKAPCDGLVTYGQPGNDWMRERIKIGQAVHQGWVLATIPDLSSFEITLKIGEEYRSRVEKGQAAVSTFDAVAGVSLKGAVEEISNLATPVISWDSASPKVYSLKVRLSESHPKLVPGMSARVEISTGEIPDALCIPIEAVHFEGGKPYCLLAPDTGPAQRRELVLGPGTDTEISVTSGLSGGERVLVGAEEPPP